MNKYAALGLLVEAHEGRRIIVVSADLDAATSAIAEFEHAGLELDQIATVVKVHGRQRIDLRSGGSIRFLPIYPGRGAAPKADLVFLDTDQRLGEERVSFWNKCVMASPTAEIVQA